MCHTETYVTLDNKTNTYFVYQDVKFLSIIQLVKKTKEVIFYFRQKDNVHSDISIKGKEVESVNEYKYLGVVFDEKLDWSKNSITIQKKITSNQRLFFMKKFILLM